MPVQLFEDYRDVFTRSALFDGLPEELCLEIITCSQRRTFARDEYLLHQGELPGYTALILSGNLITLRSNSEGDESVIRLLKPGETCMEAILFPHAGPSPISVRAVRESEVLCIPAKEVERLSRKNAQFSRNLVNILAFFYRLAMQQIDNITIQNSQARLGRYLLSRYLETDNEQFELSFRKTDIAHHLGMTPETLSRTLKQLQKDHILVAPQGIALHQPNALCQFCSKEMATQCQHAKQTDCLLR